MVRSTRARISPEMTILSAAEDFTQRTLRVLGTPLERLLYVSGLRNDDGIYSHWGMRKTYGPQGAHNAIAECHHLAMQEVLREPLARMLVEVEQSEGGAITAANIGLLAERLERLVPEGTTVAAREHFSSVVDALISLSTARAARPNRQNA